MERVRKILKGYKGGIIAFSGGKDSLALCLLAKEVFGKNHLCITVKYPYTHRWTVQKAEELAKEFSLNHRIVELPLPYELRENQPLRCYWCKRRMFEKLTEFKEEGWGIFEGSLQGEEAREGLRAAWEVGVLSPLAEAKVGKRAVMKFLKERSVEEIPSETCLLTRLPLRAKFDQALLRRLESLEDFLRERGIPAPRARWHSGVVRLEVKPAYQRRVMAMKGELTSLAKELGFEFLALDLEGYRRGSMEFNPGKG